MQRLPTSRIDLYLVWRRLPLRGEFLYTLSIYNTLFVNNAERNQRVNAFVNSNNEYNYCSVIMLVRIRPEGFNF